MARFSRWIFILIAVAVLVFVYIGNKDSFKLPGPPGKEEAPQQQNNQGSPDNAPQAVPPGPPGQGPQVEIAPPDVSIKVVSPESYTSQSQAFGVAQAEYELSLKSQVTGQILSLSEQFNNGLSINKGDVLLSVDASDYQASLATAKAEVAEAKLSLLEAQREAIQAKAEWKAMGLKGKPSSQLVLHGPQVAAAKAVLNKAFANLKSAQRDQTNTKVIAPFNAVVTERLVTPGDYIQTGTEIASLYSSDRMEVAIALPNKDWENLPTFTAQTTEKWTVELNSVESNSKWLGYVSRVEQHLDEATRQRTLIVAIDNPLDQIPALLPGMFLKASISGRQIEGLWKLPNSSLSQRNEVWFVKTDNTISKISAKVIFSDAEFIYVLAPEHFSESPQKILINPLNSYLEGMLVTPVELDSKEASIDE